MCSHGPGGDDFSPSNKTQMRAALKPYLVTVLQAFDRGTTYPIIVHDLGQDGLSKDLGPIIIGEVITEHDICQRNRGLWSRNKH